MKEVSCRASKTGLIASTPTRAYAPDMDGWQRDKSNPTHVRLFIALLASRHFHSLSCQDEGLQDSVYGARDTGRDEVEKEKALDVPKKGGE